jgi:hypothetical protein
MDQPGREVWDITNSILRSRAEVIQLGCEQRAKFEGWLKFEVAVALQNSHTAFCHVTLEDGLRFRRKVGYFLCA